MTRAMLSHSLERTRTIMLMGALLIALQGCSDKPDPKKDKDENQTTAKDESARADEESEGLAQEEPIKVSEIQPEFMEFGPEGMSPDQLIINTKIDLVSGSRTELGTRNDGGRVDLEKNTLVIEPPIQGRLERGTNRSLIFRPNTAFKPGRTYKVRLESIQVADNSLTPDAPWTYEFKTPPFEFVSMSTPVRIDAQTVETELNFSAPPSTTQLTSYLNFTYAGQAVRDVSIPTSQPGTTIRVRLRNAIFGKQPNKKLAVKVGEGIPFDNEIKAAAASAEAVVIQGPEVDILSVYKREGTSGFYVEVVCDDDGVPGDKRYYWDRQIYEDFEVSSRCMPTVESARRFIEFTPKVDFEIAPSGAGFRIFGDFKRRTYNLKIKPGLRTDADGILRVTYDEDLTIPEREPRVNFTTKGRYIPKEAWDQIAFRHLNVDKAEITIRHIPYNNLVFWMSGGNENADARVANVVLKEELKLENPEDKEQTSWIDVRSLLPEPQPGVYEIEVEGRGRRDESRLLITDINLVAKRAATAPGAPWSKEIYAWAFGMRDIKPRSGVEIKAVRPSGKVLGRCTTDVRGGCVLTLPEKDVDETPPFALVASKEGDFTYLKYSELSTQDSDGSSYGKPYLDEQRYTAVIYGDRDLYRPGETGRFVTMLRDGSSHEAPKAGLPVEVVMRDSRSRLIRREVLKTNAAGMLEISEEFDDFAPTGRYRMEAKVGKKLVASYSFSIEEFVPERMRVRAKLAKKDYLVGKTMAVDVDAKYLFGGSAEGSRAEVRCWLRPSSFTPKKNKDYSYNTISATRTAKTIDLGTATSQIDAEDKANIECPITDEAESFEVSGTVSANVSVFEAGSGRVTTSSASADVHPAPYYIGLKTQTKKARAGKDFEVEGIVVNWEGEEMSGVDQVEVSMVRMVSEYGWYFDENVGYERYHWYRRPVEEGKQVAKVQGGKFKLKFSPREDGSAFIVRAESGKARSELEVPGARQHYYWWSRDASTDFTPSPQKPGSVPIEVAEEVELGQDIPVTFEAPFKGRALLTVETHRVVEQQWMDVNAGENKWTFKVKDFVPNVYVSALIIKDPHLDSQEAFLPGRAIGVSSVKIKPKRYTHDIKLNTPKEIRSESKFTVSIDIGPQDEETWATIAAVDEGVLSLSKFKTPDPNSAIFARRALGVDTFDTVGWALQLEHMRGKPGGGDEYDEEESMAEAKKSGKDDAGLGRPKAIKPVALWSGLVKVPKSGKLQHNFEVPLYRGALRVMVVTASKNRVGSAESEVLVRDPITIQSTLPRFLTANDEVHIPVFVSNVSGKKRAITVNFEAKEQELEGLSKAKLPDSPLVQLLSESSKQVTLEDGRSETVIFRVKGLRQSGIAKFKVIASDGDIASRDEAIVPFIPGGPKETKVTRVEVPAGTTDLMPYLSGWEPTSERTTFWLTNNPYGEAFDHLKYLIRYPYGCIEQTTSSTRPLLFVSDILVQVAPEIAPKQEEIDKMVRHGIRRVLSMQTSAGGFAYWPGGRYPDAWGTAYATHMLIDAKAKGYDVPQQRLDSALEWLEGNVGRSTYVYAEPYMHYVLAVADRGNKGRVQKLINVVETGTNTWYNGSRRAESLYLLKASLYKMGDHRFAKELENPDVSAINNERSYGYSYYSDLRRRALSLAVFYDLFGKNEKGELLAQLVANRLGQQRSYWYTTQEIVWGVTALGKWLEGSASSFEDAKLTVNGNEFEITQTNPKKTDRTWGLIRASEYSSIKLDLQKKSEGKLYMIISSEGVRTNPTVQFGGQGFSIKREYFDASGKPLNLGSIKLGDVVYSRVTLKNNTNETIDNVALVERFPAGWEIENPNLGRGNIPPGLSANLWRKEHQNLRDDRVEAFGKLYAGKEVTLVVALRATSAGVFKAPAASAEAMYDPTKWARVDGQRVVIVGPWED